MLFVPGLRRAGRRWIAAVVIFYLALSSQAGAGLLARTLTGRYQPLVSADQARDARVVVVLGAGSVNPRAGGRPLASVTREGGARGLGAGRVFETLDGA